MKPPHLYDCKTSMMPMYRRSLSPLTFRAGIPPILGERKRAAGNLARPAIQGRPATQSHVLGLAGWLGRDT